MNKGTTSFSISPGTDPTTAKLFNNPVTGAPELIRRVEDCTTGIALATRQFTGDLFIADLTQATFTPGTPGTWSAPSQIVNFPEFDSLGTAPAASRSRRAPILP